MSLRYYMRNATTSAFVDITDRCRTYQLDVTQKAEEGAVGISSLIIDDPDGDLDVGGWRVFYIYETEAEVATQTCIYVGHSQPERQIIRGPYRTGAARQWRVQLSDVNNMLYRSVMLGKDNDRPAETDTTRVAWVLTTDETEVIGDTRYVTGAAGVAMDANDYLLQETHAVYNDAAQQSGRNFFLTHFGDTGPYPFGDYSLFYDSAEGSNYSSTHRLTNDLTAIGSNTFAVTLEPVEFTIDSSRIANRAIVPYTDSYATATTPTGTVLPYRDVVYPSINVNSKAVALVRANRYAQDARTPEHRATLQFHTSRAKVNAIREGMRVPVKMTHWPEPYRSEFTWMRILSRTVTDISEQDDMTYLHTIEVSRSEPAVVSPVGGILYLTKGPVSGRVWFAGTGDSPPAGHTPITTSATLTPLQDVNGPFGTGWSYYGWTVLGTGTIDVQCSFDTVGVLVDNIVYTITWGVQVNGVTVASTSNSVSGFLVFYGGNHQTLFEDIAVATNDQVTILLTCTPSTMPFFGTPGGTGFNTQVRIVGGSLV